MDRLATYVVEALSGEKIEFGLYMQLVFCPYHNRGLQRL